MRKSLLFSFALGIVASAHLEPVLARAYADVPKSALYVDDGDQNLIQGVVNSAAGPVPGVTVSVVGTSYSTQTDANGRFRINAQRGSTLRFTNVGYRSKDVVVGTGNEIVVSLEAQEAAIEEVLVTAEFGVKRTGRAVGSSVQQIDGATISESGRENFISALAGRVPGLNVTSTSGSPGASTTVVLRNITSISGNNQPLYVIDGVPMNNSSFDPLGGMAGGGSGTYSVRNLDFSSRGNDFNPEDVESVTVLKGAAAAALYGSDASNGAIIITTKKGRAGKGRVNYSNYFKWDQAYGYPDMQTKYANGNYGTTNYYFTSKFGGLYPEGMQLYDNIAAILQTGYSGRHNISVEGGSDKATLRAGFSQLNQDGVVKTTGYDRTNLSLAGQAQITDWLKFEGAIQYTKTGNNKVLRGTDGPLYRAMLWPMVDNMENYLAADGSHMKVPDYYVDEDLLNPLFALYRNKFFDKSDRFLSNVALNLTPVKNTFVRAQVGWDVGMQTFETSAHPYYANRNAGLGQYNLVQSNFSDPTVNIIAGYNNKFFNEKFSLSGQVGYHQLENAITRSAVNGTTFLVPDFQSINNTDPATQTATQRNTKRRIQALSAQFELGYNNIAFITLRGRNDWSSTLPIDNNRYFYPAIEGSFILSDLEFMKAIPAINYVKLRGSLAQVGKDAGPLEIDPQLETTGLTGGGFKYGTTGPNPNLRPEMTTAHEAGLDLRMFNNRLNASFTYFGTRNDDQIVKGFRLSYATGFVLNNMNVGSFKTWGWEGHIDGDIIKVPDGLTWNLGVNASRGFSKVLYLPENVTEYYNAYTWNSGNIRNGIMTGQPITTLTGLAYERNNKGDILISPTTGLPITSSVWSVIGDREPKLRFGVTSSLTYKSLRLSALFAGRLGATVVNGTKRTMMTNGTSWESVALRESGPVVFDGVLRDGNENSDNPTRNTIALDYRTYGATIYGGADEDWLEKNVNYLRMQELRLSYRLPQRFLSKAKIISGMDIYFVGNDLFTWTNYSGIDAVGNTVSAAAGGTGGEGYDVWSLPNPRGFSVGLSLTLN
ncbi:TonB-linked SusC/RagA family outer membrane protein [Sphingobacterium allocomposti]|uniref:TonB-linked SusC/RagA family outer membrane protein n=1 Tax=Sphingobacterium allocomposti TaxID=415956 RepID=A0A5S5D5D2_9SPHI|nr:SusC/RagA family TonB-linked outer membrane protein [Sphingobacterium composti Yoo et al. 2007 non Ten et al. 2007]TYP91161.1 TonB-linked SusC/RagA family outer membrane protein [Sphingobacterium composti Yoo et al. 2007 non Ten et al. 2007]